MKKIFFFLAILMVAISVSACTIKKPSDVNRAATAPLLTPVEENSNLAANEETAPVALATSSEVELVASSTPVEEVNKTMKSPEQQEDLTKKYSQALIKTSMGDFQVKFYTIDSPVTVNNFLNLAQAGFYNGTKFHRVIADFMIQGGDPLSKGADTSVYGTGGPDYRFNDEFNNHKLVLGSLAMANSGPNTNGSQFFVVTASETPWLDGRHTNFGEVVSGLDVVQKIGAVATGVNDRPLQDVVINSIELLK